MIPLAAALIAVCLLAAPASAATLRVAAAASAQEAIAAIARDFEAGTRDAVRLSVGSSGKLYHQITHGAPFDLFFSADTDYPRKLAEAGLAHAPVPYARGRLALWAPKGGPIHPARGLEALDHPKADRVAIANPTLAPYGRAAVEALTHAGLYDRVKPKLVYGENIAQAAQFVDAGAAPVGLISLSLAVSPRLSARGSHWLVPASHHRPITAEAAVIQRSARAALARRFLAYATGPEAAPVWRRYGLEPCE